ncbi:putative general secretion pathway protein D [Candidatus Nitrospira nitrificans]|uniref:Putative general secretion pathway protein D n=1 Tax=Candidatus Nitrospira nitrificans TaxID=1742973 RepID=A0A0S4LDS4_9BACT|nr:putative general secretion pathway protein D [Candidatus Nitrospira nitrificans]
MQARPISRRPANTTRNFGICLILALLFFLALPPPLFSQSAGGHQTKVALEFNEVEIPVFVRFISELTGKNFVLDETIKKQGGKVSVFSPTKVSSDQAFTMFVAALEAARIAVVPKGGNLYQVVPMGDLPPERGVFVYKLKHANATDLAAVLTNLVARSQTVAQMTPGTRPPVRPLTEFEAPVQVFADKATNSIVISATKLAWSHLQAVIRDLDIRRKQVFVEAVILEVQVDRLRQIGTDPTQVLGAGKSGFVQGIGGFNRAPEDLATFAQAITGAAAGGATGGAAPLLNTLNVRAFMNLLMNLTDTNVLSTPQVLAADNQKAKIVVGENRPFPTGQAQGITGGTLVTIERKDVGVTLELTPQVLEGDLIRLEIKQEITAIAENVAQTIGSGTASIPVGPTTTKRSMETTTVAQDQQTLVVGGLVRDNITLSERKIPLLGDIPWLGWLFKSQSRQIEKLNLLVFLTPHLVRDDADVVELNARKAKDINILQRDNRIEEPTKLKQDVLERLELPSTVPPSSLTDKLNKP